MYHRTGNVQARSGDAVPNASVQVTVYPGGGAATIYAVDDNTQPAIANNTVTTDNNGNYAYYIDAGLSPRITETVSWGGLVQQVLTDIPLSSSIIFLPAEIQLLSQTYNANGTTNLDLTDASLAGKYLALLEVEVTCGSNFTTDGEQSKASVDFYQEAGFVNFLGSVTGNAFRAGTKTFNVDAQNSSFLARVNNGHIYAQLVNSLVHAGPPGTSLFIGVVGTQ